MIYYRNKEMNNMQLDYKGRKYEKDCKANN